MRRNRSGIPGLILGILDPSTCEASRAALAAELGVDAVMVMHTDPELDISLPAPGFPQRLPQAALWREQVRAAAEKAGPVGSRLPFPDGAAWKAATTLAIPDGTAIILLGGAPSGKACAELADWLPWISRVFATASALRQAQAEKAMALNAVDMSNRMSATLEGLRRSLETALRNAETEQANARREQEERRKFVALVENSGEFICMAGLDGRVFYLNPYGRSLVGIAGPADYRDMSLGDFFQEEFRPSFSDISLPAVLSAGHWEGEVRFTNRRTGAPLDVVQTLFLVRDPETQAPICIANVARDMTEHKRAEETLRRTEAQLQQTQKMESIGKLAGGIAHDFNNLLTAINGYADLSLAVMDASHPLYEYLNEIRKAGERAASLTGQLLAYSRKQVLASKVIDINALVSNLHGMLSRIIGEDLTLSLSLKKDLGKVKADPGQIEQVILNLVVNARDATPGGGQIVIETEDVRLDETVVGIHPEILPGTYVRLAISDNGSGMEPHVLARIFEPFFTTKEFGKGSGMGLSMVQGIVNQTGGYIYAYSEPGRGSVFKIYLPHTGPASIPPDGGAGAAPADYRGKETVLLAEDEESVRRLTRGILEMQGYTVLEAADGLEGERLSERHPGRIDLLLTDVIMPRKNGRDLAQGLKKTRPQAKVIFMSGYTDDAIVRHGFIDMENAFIQKPFSPKHLIRTVREILDASSKRPATS